MYAGVNLAALCYRDAWFVRNTADDHTADL
eukprot:COSAG05_NODE_1319_length_5194_cov_20.004534_4_plen_30_part_00